MANQGVLFLLWLTSSQQSLQITLPSLHLLSCVHVPSSNQIVLFCLGKSYRHGRSHTGGRIKPQNSPWAGSVVLEYPGLLDGKDQPLLPLLLRFGVSLVVPSSLLFMGPDSEVLEVEVLPASPACFLCSALWNRFQLAAAHAITKAPELFQGTHAPRPSD